MIEQELLKVTGLKPKGKEDRQDYIKRLVLAASNDIQDDEWERLSETTQKWVVENGKLIKEEKELMDFDEDTGDDEVAAAGAEEQQEEEPRGGNGKSKKKAKPVKKEKVAAKKEGGQLDGGGIKVRIKRMILKKPALSAEELYEKLKADGGGETPSKMTVSGIRAEFRHSLRLLQQDGWLSKELDI